MCIRDSFYPRAKAAHGVMDQPVGTLGYHLGRGGFLGPEPVFDQPHAAGQAERIPAVQLGPVLRVGVGQHLQAVAGEDTLDLQQKGHVAVRAQQRSADLAVFGHHGKQIPHQREDLRLARVDGVCLHGGLDAVKQFGFDCGKHLVNVSIVQVKGRTVHIGVGNKLFYGDVAGVFLLHQFGQGLACLLYTSRCV